MPFTVKCPTCSREIAQESRFCLHCGAAMESVVGVSPTVTSPLPERPARSQTQRNCRRLIQATMDLKAMMDVPGKWMDRFRQHRALDELILDLDISLSESFGR